MTSSGSGVYRLREWWAATSTRGRVFVIGLLVGVAALIVWALIPSEKERQVEDCAKRSAAIDDGETPYEKRVELAEGTCAIMWDSSH
jgi:hypothetical protein